MQDITVKNKRTYLILACFSWSIIAPLLLSLSNIFIPFISILTIIFCVSSSTLCLPAFFLVNYILYDYIILFLLSSKIEHSFVFFHGYLILILICYLFMAKSYNNKYIILFIGIIVFSSLMGFINGANIISILSFVRNIIVFPGLLYCVVHYNNKMKVSYVVMLSFILMASLYTNMLQDFFGFEKYFFSLGIDLFYAARNISQEGTIPIGFQTVDLLGNTAYRPMGIFLSSDKVAYVATSFLLILFIRWVFHSKSNAVWKYVSFGILTILGVSLFHVKAPILVCCIFFFSATLYRIGVTSSHLRFLLSVMFLLIGLYLTLMLMPRSFLASSGAMKHLWGLTQPFTEQHNFFKFLFGNGLGFGGTVGQAFTDSGLSFEKGLRGGESFIGALFFQTGLLGLTSYVLVLKNIDKSIRAKSNSNYGYSCASSLVIALLVTSAFSEAVFSLFQSSCFAIVILSCINRSIMFPSKTAGAVGVKSQRKILQHRFNGGNA